MVDAEFLAEEPNFSEKLPDDPRRSGWGQEWHAPDGRVSHIRKVAVAGSLRVGVRTESLAGGDFIVWQDGEYKTEPCGEVIDGAWDLEGPSALEFDALAEEQAAKREAEEQDTSVEQGNG